MRFADLVRQNRRYAGSGGVSANNQQLRFMPAFKDASSEQVVLSRFRDGRLAPMHTLDGLPEDWITERDARGRAKTTRKTVIAGFVRDDTFYTRQQAAETVATGA